MKRILFLIILVFGIQLISSAQRRFPQELVTQLQGKKKFSEIMDIVNRYYDFGRKNIVKEPGGDDFESNDYEWWKKWEYWAKRRQNPDGTLPDYKAMNWLARQEVDAKFGPQLRQAAESFKKLPPIDDRIQNRHTPGVQNPNLSYGGWSSIGPTSGGTIVGSGTNIDINGLARMDRIAFHPTNGSIFYVCSPSGGVYKTTNGGTTWTDISEGLPGGAACIEVARSNGNVIYVFSGDGDSHYSSTLVFGYDLSPISRGVFKSTDAGASWTRVTDMYTGPNDLVGHNFAISETNSNFLFAATDQGLYRTTDGGTSWTQVQSGNFYDVEFRPYNDSVVYSSTASNVYYSNNGGRSGTWNTATFDFPASANRIELGVRKNNLSASSIFVYALAGDAFIGSFRGLFLSTDGGQTYTRQSNTPNILGSTTNGSDGDDQTRYDLGICVRPDDFTKIATAGLCVWRSTNSGVTMVYATTYREGNGPISAYIHPDVHDVQYNPVNNILYACTDGGVYSSSDDGVTWTDLSSGLAATQFYHMGMQDADGDGDMDGINLVAGAQDNGIKYRTTGGSWRHIVCCDGYGSVINGNDPDWLVVNLNARYYQTPDGGVTMNNKGNVSFFMPMAVDYDNGDTMYMAASSLLRSYDGFVTTNATLAFDLNNFIATCPSNNARLYGSSSSSTNLRISEDRGASWTTISGNPGWPAGSPVVTDCKPWPTNSSEIYVTFGGYTSGVKVYRSTDAGLNWVNYSGTTLPNIPIHSCAVAPEGVYVGTEMGVFFRADGAADWTPFYTGMPSVIVTDMWVNDNGRIYASTFGRGVWLSNRFTACDAVINVSGALAGPHYYEASTTANVTATSNAGEGTNIFVKSNGYVDLLVGFEIKAGTFFKAYLGPCSTGIPNTNRPAGSAELNRNIIEYDDKDQAARRKDNNAYYSLAEDGIEVNLPATAILDVEVLNTKTNEVKKLVTNIRMTKGMYKILTGEGTFAVKVRLNGGTIPIR